ncbi:MAG TPA: hypothetical protein DCP31_34420 [Cyanobacteria bacterium UBA8543]|nr:hypothetical protein [Cyanobacteria bacterium UBA8543]
MNKATIYQTIREILVEQQEDYVVKNLEVAGKFGESKAKKLRRQIDVSISNGANIFIVNLKNVYFMESSGLAALVLIQKRIQAAGCKLFLVSISAPVKMLFELTSLDSVFQILSERTELNERSSLPITPAKSVTKYANALSS